MRNTPILRLFIQGTEQGVGKTTVTLALIKALKEERYQVGYFKPVSHNQSFGAESIIPLLRDLGILESKKILNPILVDRSFIKNYLDKQAHTNIKEKIIKGFHKVSKNKDVVLIEGAGHVGVGSILGYSNAQLAKLLNAPIILVAPGGIGKTFDLVNLNKTFIEASNCELLGVVVNKILQDSYSQIKKYLNIAFKTSDISCLAYLKQLSDKQSADEISMRKVDAIAKEIRRQMDIPKLLTHCGNHLAC